MAAGIRQRLVTFNAPRRIVQVLSFVFLSAIVFNLGALPLLLPVLWTWGLPQNTAGDAFTAMQLTLSGWNAIYFAFPWLAFASFVITGILIGKTLCGWICPFGLIQDLLMFIRRKKTEFSPRNHGNAILMKYLVLGITLFISATFAASKVFGGSTNYASALGIFATAPFTSLSPAETLFATLPRLIRGFTSDIVVKPAIDVLSSVSTLPALFWVEFAILIAVLVFAAYVPRAWCRYLCPHGAIMAILNNFSFIGLRRDPVKCARVGCKKCQDVCPMRVPILDQPWEKFSHEECIYCMKCVDACENKAIRPTFP